MINNNDKNDDNINVGNNNNPNFEIKNNKQINYDNNSKDRRLLKINKIVKSAFSRNPIYPLTREGLFPHISLATITNFSEFRSYIVD